VKWLDTLLGRRRPEPEASSGPAVPEVPAATAGPPKDVAPPADADLERLERWAARTPRTQDEMSELDAERILDARRGTTAERRVVEVLVRAAKAHPLGDRLAHGVARTLRERGELELAMDVVGECQSPEGLLLRSELAFERGDTELALTLVERILLVDIDYPGARERALRLRGLLSLAPAPVGHAPGATLVTSHERSPFRIVRELARGGAGTVYEARDVHANRTVAVKIYHDIGTHRSMLVHEARTAARIAGPGIVRIFDLDPRAGWIALEWADAGSLKMRLAEGATRPWSTPVDHVLEAVANALARVHDAGLVHHDVKPANVLLFSQRTPVLGDFGTARAIGAPPPPGSLGYISPERERGRPSSPKDDVFAFGRVVEDVLESAGNDLRRSHWAAIAKRCTGPDDERPRDGAELVRMVVHP
jgi:hypothetical protein